MLEYIVNAPVEIQVILATLALIGAIVVYKFRYLVGVVAIGAIGVYMSLKKGKK